MNTFANLKNLISNIQARQNNKPLSLDAATSKVIQLIKKLKKNNKLIFVGNGGSASIASHISIDFLKNAKIPAICFNDASLLTCISNDLGYEFVFQKPLEMLALKVDIVFAISSSGKSKNILNAALAAKKIGCILVTLSGFNKNNPLRKLGEINFYTPSNSYGDVEITHLIICHAIVDQFISSKNG